MMDEISAEEGELWLAYFADREQKKEESKQDGMLSPDEFLKGFHASFVGQE